MEIDGKEMAELGREVVRSKQIVRDIGILESDIGYHFVSLRVNLENIERRLVKLTQSEPERPSSPTQERPSPGQDPVPDQ